MWGVIVHMRIHNGREKNWERIFAEHCARVRASKPGAPIYDSQRSKEVHRPHRVKRFASEVSYLAHRGRSVGHVEMLACINGDLKID